MRAFALLRHDDGVWDNPQGAFAWTGTAVATRKTDGRMTRMTAVRDTPETGCVITGSGSRKTLELQRLVNG